MLMTGAFNVVRYAALLLFICCNLLSCNSESNESSVFEDQNIRSPIGEPSFIENFNIHLDLPVSEAVFLELLEYNDIEHRVYLPHEAGTASVPRLNASLNREDTSKVIIIVDRDRSNDEFRRFVAFINNEGFVVYIENYFGYRNPY